MTFSPEIRPDPFAPSMVEQVRAWQDPTLSQAFDVWISPEPDARRFPGDAIARRDDLGPSVVPGHDRRRSNRDETRFFTPAPTEASVWEVVRVTYARPGYLVRVVTFLEVKTRAGELLYLSNDLADPAPTFAGLVVRWHLLAVDSHATNEDPIFLVNVPAAQLPTAHRVDTLPARWDDMRYHWGQRPANKLARIARPTHVRLFVEFVGLVSAYDFRIGGQLGGWEGEK